MAIPALVVLVVGSISVGSSALSEQGYQKNQQLANLSGEITSLVQALQDERQDIVTFITMADQGGRASALSANPAQKAEADAVGQQALVAADMRRTGTWAARVRSLAVSIGSSYPAQAQQQAQGAITVIDNLRLLEQAATGSRLPVLTVINYYDATITQLLTLESDVASGSNNAALADDVRVLNLMSNMKEEAAEQQAIVTSALPPDEIGADQLNAESLSVLSQDASEQSANTNAFELAATSAQRQLYNGALSSPLVATAQQQLGQAESLLASGTTSTSDPTLAVAAEDTSFITSSLGLVERQLMSSIISQSSSLRARAAETAVIQAVGVLLLLTVALLLIVVVARSLSRPLRRLRSGALYVAGVRLPEMVRRMSENDAEGVPLEVEPIDVQSADEVGEVARAFDQVHREALRLAANEAALRGNVNAMFVNLSRRIQSLVERQIRLITQLEQDEQDSRRLGSLFQMDHLATRMRRNSENLLVLAGHELSRRSRQPVALVDVVRAALSEIERYARVTLNVLPSIWVRREAVRDVVHLTSELVENATSFSPAETPVVISGRLLSSGGVLLEITDQGVGMGSEEMARVNDRLENPPVVDVGVARHMGLFVVARLAARHGIRVRMRAVPSGGLSAQVWLPGEMITREGAAPARPRAVPRVRVTDESREASVSGADTDQHAGTPGAPDHQAPASSPDEAVVPAAAAASGHSRLPIFEAIESDWSRLGRTSIAKDGQSDTDSTSVADDGGRAAEVVRAPASAGTASADTTEAGLPKRVRQANLVPETAAAAGGTPLRSVPGRSAAENRNRLARLQHGVRQGRSVVSSEKPDGGKGKSS